MNPTKTHFPAGWPTWLRERVAAPNCAVGTHIELRSIAFWIPRYSPPQEAFRWLKAAAQRCDRIPPDSELKRLLGWAACARGEESDTYARRPAAIDMDRLYNIITAGPTLGELRESSPERCWDTRRRHTARILDAWAAYAGAPDPCVCFGAADDFYTRRLSVMRAWAHAHPQIVPSPMISQYGRTVDGHLSQHTLDATGPRIFLVTEFDFTPVNARREPTIWKPLIDRCAARAVVC